MLKIVNAEILKYTRLNDWDITHVFKNYENDNGKGYYSFADNMEKKFRESAYADHRTEEFVSKLKDAIG